MGSTGALGMKESVDMEWVRLENALVWHLRSNHYPPVPTCMVEPCMKAIRYANKGKWDTKVRLPEGVLYKGKYKTAPVFSIIEAHHLESFLDSDDDEYFEDEDEE